MHDNCHSCVGLALDCFVGGLDQGGNLSLDYGLDMGRGVADRRVGVERDVVETGINLSLNEGGVEACKKILKSSLRVVANCAHDSVDVSYGQVFERSICEGSDLKKGLVDMNRKIVDGCIHMGLEVQEGSVDVGKHAVNQTQGSIDMS